MSLKKNTVLFVLMEVCHIIFINTLKIYILNTIKLLIKCRFFFFFKHKKDILLLPLLKTTFFIFRHFLQELS